MVLAASEFAATLSNERLRLTLAVRDWLVGEAHDISDPNVIIESSLPEAQRRRRADRPGGQRGRV